ncbi:MAG: aspartyl-phosphate phosphatase Spo0E family protein [Halanaerobiales bacterium]|nr:aspartyl-phosphate phosphatase Spo0E family protein [Halanaerobiales bacterium]
MKTGNPLNEQIEVLRAKMIKYYIGNDRKNAVEISQKLDRKIYDYLQI